MISIFKEFIFKICKGVILMLGQVLLTDITNVAFLGWLCIRVRMRRDSLNRLIEKYFKQLIDSVQVL